MSGAVVSPVQPENVLHMFVTEEGIVGAEVRLEQPSKVPSRLVIPLGRVGAVFRLLQPLKQFCKSSSVQPMSTGGYTRFVQSLNKSCIWDQSSFVSSSVTSERSTYMLGWFLRAVATALDFSPVYSS